MTRPAFSQVEVTAVHVTVDSVSLSTGHTAIATVKPTDRFGNTVTGLAATWKSLSPAVATIDLYGNVAAISPGSAQIQATVSGFTGRATVVVPQPPPPGGTYPADLVLATFEDGTASGMSGVDGNDVKIINDPTGAGKGKVLSLHYYRSPSESPGVNVDRNRYITYEGKVGLGQTIFFSGEVYFDVSTMGTPQEFARKVLYYQPYANAAKYGGRGGPVMLSTAGGFGSEGKGVDLYQKADGTLIDVPYFHGTLLPRRWQRIEKQITMNSAFDRADGISRVWIDGVLVYEKTNLQMTDPAWIGQPVRDGNGTPLESADVWLKYFLVGDQVNSHLPYDEYRYWNNVAFSTKRISP